MSYFPSSFITLCFVFFSTPLPVSVIVLHSDTLCRVLAPSSPPWCALPSRPSLQTCRTSTSDPLVPASPSLAHLSGVSNFTNALHILHTKIVSSTKLLKPASSKKQQRSHSSHWTKSPLLLGLLGHTTHVFTGTAFCCKNEEEEEKENKRKEIKNKPQHTKKLLQSVDSPNLLRPCVTMASLSLTPSIHTNPLPSFYPLFKSAAAPSYALTSIEKLK